MGGLGGPLDGEQRGTVRVRVVVPARWEADGRRQPVRLLDLSPTGARLAGALPEGGRGTLRFTVGLSAFRLPAVIVWSHPDTGRSGARFVSVGISDHLRLALVCQELARRRSTWGRGARPSRRAARRRTVPFAVARARRIRAHLAELVARGLPLSDERIVAWALRLEGILWAQHRAWRGTGDRRVLGRTVPVRGALRRRVRRPPPA
jgi:hypothetical protein